MTYALLSGMMAAFCLLAGALFLRSYRITRDRIFAWFAIALPILGVSQLFLGLVDHPEADYPLAYVPRLITFAIILVAIVDKNRAPRRVRANLHLIPQKRKKAG